LISSNKVLYFFNALLLTGALVAGSATLSKAGDFEKTAPVGIDGPGAATADQLAEGAAAAGGDDFNDPIEPFNRFMFDVNEGIQDFLLRPISTVYNYLPAGFRNGVGNLIHNLNTPVILANDLLQLEGQRAMRTFGRFVINTIAGAGGIGDVAGDLGIPSHKEDFGQTLGSYGVGEGFYLVLPLFGPSNPRDAVGKIFVDSYFDPLSMYLKNTDEDAAYWSMMAGKGISEYAGVMEELNQIKSTSIDYYAAIRSMYRQKRKAEIGNGQDTNLPPIPDLDLSLNIDDNKKESETAAASVVTK